MVQVVTSILLLLSCQTITQGSKINDRPIIGILTQKEWTDELKQYGSSYLVASYVKYVESAGARVIPILVNQTDAYYQKIFNSVNGVLFPGGGGGDLLESGIGRAGRHIYDMAVKSNDAGDFFPIWGTCLGFELLNLLTAGKDIRARVPVVDVSLPLKLTKDYKSSRLMKKIPDDIVKTLTTVDMTFNYHHWSITPTNFTDNKLDKFYQVLSTNMAPNGEEFISTVEAFKYPFYGSQWHPEKVPFEWNTHKEFRVNHSLGALQAVQYFANFFVNEARKNFHKFDSEEEELKYLIYKDPPVYTGNIVSYEQCYFFQ